MDSITNTNIETVRKQIAIKNSDGVLFGTSTNASNVFTDYDSFPYTRWFRGVYNSEKPIVAEREAGWRPVMNSCYTNRTTEPMFDKPNHCFQVACSTVFPCVNSNNDNLYRNSCINLYR